MKIENKTITAYYGNKGYGKTYYKKTILEKENKKLQQRIDKAIDFINAWKDNETDLKVSMLDLLQIEDILRGKDNE